jgi:hypothetical protein
MQKYDHTEGSSLVLMVEDNRRAVKIAFILREYDFQILRLRPSAIDSKMISANCFLRLLVILSSYKSE